jgi:hypothetical protein
MGQMVVERILILLLHLYARAREFVCAYLVQVYVCLAPNILTFYTAGLKYII